MKGAKLLALFLALTPVWAAAQTYMEAHGRDCAFATAFYEGHRGDFEKISGRTRLSAPFLFALVAPELTQFSALGNRLETYSLKVFYVQRGKAYADFSIGPFQMKPSFVERMEDSLRIRDRLHADFPNLLLSEPDSREARAERVRRLTQLEWQLEYLALFCTLVAERFPAQSQLPEPERLIFYAAAYNTGFHKSEESILRMSQQALFPHFSERKWRYGEVAKGFYEGEVGGLGMD